MVKIKRNQLVRIFLKNWPDDRFAYEVPYKNIRWNYPTRGFFTLREIEEDSTALFTYPVSSIATLESFTYKTAK